MLWAANRFAGSEIPKRNAFDIIDKNFENLNSISNIFQETNNFLVLTDSAIICIYLKKSLRKFLSKKKKNKTSTDISVTRGTSVVLSQSY